MTTMISGSALGENSEASIKSETYGSVADDVPFSASPRHRIQ